jgi:lipooligosaccharide transport system permease protein
MARALINQPDLLILDEPTTGLDPQARHQVWDRLTRLKADGVSVLLTTHYMEEAARLCDRLLIPEVICQGRAVSYVVFMAPALIATSIMYNAFFETTYSSFVRMYYQKTYDAMMAAPLSLEEVITGEIVWGASKSVMAAAIMAAVLGLLGLVRFPAGLLLLPLAFLGGLAFGSAGMLFTGMVRSIDTFNLPIFLFLTPMFLFSGTFFPVENLPAWAQPLAQALPLTHLVSLARAVSFGAVTTADLLVSGGYLAAFTLLCFPLALGGMRRRLIR